MKQGIYTISEQEYHADPCDKPSLTSSLAKILITKSPLHAFVAHPKLNPRFVHKESAAFDMGKAAHAYFLERDVTKIVVVEADDWRTKDAKSQRDAAREDGLYPVLRKQMQSIQDMREAALDYIKTSEISGMYVEGSTEQTLVWEESDGIWCRSRMDWISCLAKDQRILVIDYKTTDNAEPNAFGRIMNNMQYDMQAAFYKRGLFRAFGRDDVDFVFLAQETEFPYPSSLHSLSASAIEMADAKVDKAINLWTQCMKDGKFDGYPNHICYQEPPAWALHEFEQQMIQEA